MQYKLIRSKRRTIAIYVKEESVIVRAPLRVPTRMIDDFVKEKNSWIAKQLARQKIRKEKRAAFKIDHGSIVLFLGRGYRIDEIMLSSEDITSEQLLIKLIAFYKAQAKNIIENRIDHYSSLMGVHPSNIRIGSAKRSWASCSATGRLNFSWRLMMASPDAIDYVIVHELAHLKHLNHSSSFWAIVTDIMPDWKDRRKILRVLHKRLINEVWD